MTEARSSQPPENVSNVVKAPWNRDDPRFRIRPYQQAASSCTGALITSLCMTPLDVVKTRLQAQQKALVSNKCFLYCNGLMDHLCPCGPGGTVPQQKTLHFNGTLDAFAKISRAEGVRSLWSGLGPTLVLAIPATVIYFVAYEQFSARYKELYRKYINPSLNSQLTTPIMIPMLSGATARTLAVSIVNPLELIRTKMQSQKLSYLELQDCLRAMIGVKGVAGLWKGLVPTLCRDVPFSAIYWTSYENLKHAFHVTTPSFGFSFFAGAVSGCIAAFVTTPFDVVKTHHQIQFGEKVIYIDKPPAQLPSEKMIQTLRKIYISNGIKGLFAGVTPRLVKVAPACAIMIASFEYGKTFFYKLNVKRYEESLEALNKKPI